jgi:hypothetical protein
MAPRLAPPENTNATLMFPEHLEPVGIFHLN